MNGENKKIILLVEDEAIIALTQKALLEQYGYNIITASSGEKAIELVNVKPEIDLVLMDIDLGKEIDGPETATKILSIHDIPIVFLSSHTEPEIVEKTEKITSYGYVVKSSGITVLDASIKMAFKLFDAKINEKIKEDAFRESEEKYRLLHENAGIGIGYYKSDGTVISYNHLAAEQMKGNPEDFTGKSIRELFPEEQASVYIERINKSVLSDKPVSYEDIVTLPSGNKYFQSIFTKIIDINDNILGIQVISLDVTSLKLAEAEIHLKNDELIATNEKLNEIVENLQSSNEELTSTLEEYDASTEQLLNVENELIKSQNLLNETGRMGLIGGWKFDVETLELDWTDEVFRIHELDKSYKSVVKDGIDFYAPASRVLIEDAVQNAINHGTSFDLELEFITAKGNHRWVHSVGRGIQENGKTVKVMGTIQDITDRKNAQDDLKRYIEELDRRNKELNCLYSVSRIVREFDISRIDMLREISEVLINSFRYPEITTCRITLEDIEYKSGNFIKSEWLLASAITINGVNAGKIEICYLEKKPSNVYGSFDAEELKLLNAITALIGKSTERKKMIEVIEENEKKLTVLFNLIPVGISVLNKDRRIIFTNPALEEILDITSEGLLRGDYKKRTYLRSDGTPMPSEEFATTRSIAEGRSVYNVEIGVVKENGSKIWTNVSSVIADYSDWHNITTTIDISDRKIAEDKIKSLLVEKEILFK